MIRFFLFYFYVIHYRVFRLLFRAKITDDTNYLSSPILTMNRILSHPMLGTEYVFVDIGCGEGLVGLFVRLVKRQTVILHDIQSDFLRMITLFVHCFFVSRVTCATDLHDVYPPSSVFMCVWTSWSSENRRAMISRLSSIIPKGSIFISVSHGMVHPAFVEVQKIREVFAWGEASVYYYKHA